MSKISSVTIHDKFISKKNTIKSESNMEVAGMSNAISIYAIICL